MRCKYRTPGTPDYYVKTINLAKSSANKTKGQLDCKLATSVTSSKFFTTAKIFNVL
jgi:hypothetical protein